MINIKLLSSPTCMPCKILAKKLDDANIKYEKINALEHPEYEVQGTPHIIIIKDGKEIKNEHVSNIMETVKFIKEL